MSKPVKLFDYVERKKKAGSITVDLGKEHGTVVIPPMELWADEVFDTASAGDTKAAIVLLLGQDGADRFAAAGGNYRMLSGIVREQMGLSVPQSEASPEP
jgi:hypothetical protein